MKRSEDIGLLVILALATVLRLWGFSEWSLSNDELSAIHRLNVNGLGELFSTSIKIDGHPAVTQLFLYLWTGLFGKSVFAIRLPFILMSSAGIYFFYKTAALWFNSKAALLGTTVLALSQYFILFGSIARPYSVGFFFLALYSFYWSKFLVQKEDSNKNILLSTLIAPLAIMTHYFTSISIVLELTIGFFYLLQRKSQLKKYLLSLLGIILLCLPHLKITLYQFSLKGLEWLPLADEKFFNLIVPRIFNDSFLWMIFYFTLPFYFILRKRANIQLKKQLIFISLTLLPILIGYYYSYYRSPVLHFAVLYFCLPFLPYFIASFIPKDMKNLSFQFFFYGSIVLGLVSLNFSEGYRGNNKQFANFKGIVEEVIQLDKEKGEEGILHLVNVNHKDYLKFYIEDLAEGFEYDYNQFTTTQDMVQVMQLIDTTQAKYISVSYALRTVPVEIHEYLKSNFGGEVYRKLFFNSGVILYQRSEQERTVGYESVFTKENYNNFYYNGKTLLDSINQTEVLKINSTDTFPVGFYTKVADILTENDSWINIHFQLQSEQSLTALIVVEIKKDDQTTSWSSYPITDFFKKGKKYSTYKSIRIPNSINKDNQLNIYIWNLNGEEFLLYNFSIRTFVDSDYSYLDAF